ncbi:DNA primase [Nitrospira sp. Kam-Ns4a]
MDCNHILAQLEGVRPRGAGRWMARCPAHDDRTPSLSIAQGERGVLIHCFAGCTLAEIAAALKISMRDLFYAPSAGGRAPRPAPRSRRWGWREAAAALEDGAARLTRRAERILAAATGLTSAWTWTEAELDAALAAVARV